jgi:glutaredoxin 3
MSKNPNITIYGSETCPYCTAARMLLKKKGASWEEILVSRDPQKREEMISRSGHRTVPQIFIDELLVGGFDELYALEQAGELDRLLSVQD